ncbi:TonB-dependent receptor [Brevundimonas sp.]|jgi:hypothetical protein|uniref:TonB-dependent receptor n=1 Tax=Brevundimonas sp. TaxID=1871086 RepID=UPI0037BEA2A8
MIAPFLMDFPVPLIVQVETAPAPTVLEDVAVVGRRGAARVAPERELDADAIDTLGAYDIGEVVARFGQTLSLTQPPVVIVNGRRVFDAGAFLAFPADALVRIEALPAQAGALYGGDPSRRVLNIVLAPEFHSRDALAKASRPTAGGASTLALDARRSALKDTQTLQFGLQGGRTTALRADEREDGPGDPRTLRPAVETFTANMSATGALGAWAGSFSAALQSQGVRLTSGTSGAPQDIRQNTDTLTVAAGLTGQAFGWSVRFGLDGLAAENRQEEQTASLADSRALSATVSVDRRLTDLPAGPLVVTADALYSRAWFGTRTPDLTERRSSQGLALRSGVAVPLWSPLVTERGGLGALSANLGVRLDVLDGGGADGQGMNAGLSWTPAAWLQLAGQWARGTEPPSREQRFDPLLYGAPRTVYDFRLGEAVEILPLSGGDPDLRSQQTQTFSVTTSVGPFGRWALQAGLDYQSANTTDAVGALPPLSPEIEAAFPDRFLRDAAGRLVGIDERPINFEALASRTLSTSLTASLPFGGGPEGSRRRGSLQLALNHVWRIEDAVVIRPDLGALDQLKGDGGGVARRQLMLRLDGRYGRWGANLDFGWRSGARIRKILGRNDDDDLRLSSFAALNLKVSTALGRLKETVPQAEGRGRSTPLRVALEVENLFDARPTVRLGDGRPAPGYGRSAQDPLGRIVRVQISHRF